MEAQPPGGQGYTLRFKNKDREEKQALAQLDSIMGRFKKALFRYQREARDDAWAPYVQAATDFVNRKPMKHGRGTMGQSPEEIEISYEAQPPGGVGVGDSLRVGAFEMQRQAARDYKKNQEVQVKGKQKLDDTNTFRLRVPPQAGPGARGYRSQAVLWTDKVYDQAMDKGRAGTAGYLAGGGLALYEVDGAEGEKGYEDGAHRKGTACA